MLGGGTEIKLDGPEDEAPPLQEKESAPPSLPVSTETREPSAPPAASFTADNNKKNAEYSKEEVNLTLNCFLYFDNVLQDVNFLRRIS